MKVTITLLSFLLAMITLLHSNTAHAQSPQLFNYQGIARDVKGNPLANQKMSLKISLLPAADAVQPEYEESHEVTTNEFGLYTLQIGNGTPLTGDIKNVKWESGNKYIHVAIDPKGGDSYTDAGTNQLLSVPYAMYADKAGATSHTDNDKTRSGSVSTSPAGTGTLNYLTKFTAANTIYNSQIFDNGTNIGIGTASPVSKLHLRTISGNVEHIRMQNTNATGFGKFLMHNDAAGNYATFTKYGSAYPGGYPGIASLYPYANMLAFGNNLGPFLLANNGNVGLGIVTAGTTKLYFNAQQNTGYLGIGGSALPSANVHFNNNTTGDTLRITNATTGHTANDGLEIRNTGNAASIVNKENSTLTLGTNNATRLTIGANGYVGIGTTAPDDALHIKRSYSSIKLEDSNDNAVLYIVAPDPSTFTTGGIGTSTNHELPFFTNNVERLVMKADGKIGINTNTPSKELDVNGQVRIRGGNPAYGKILTADDTTGSSSWKYPIHLAHYIGELWGGGIVFNVWRDAFGNEHGLVASLDDLGMSRWGDTSVFVAGATSKWNGAANTSAIILSGAIFSDAAFVCDNYNSGNYFDWYLPASQELMELNANLLTINRVLETDLNNMSQPIAGPYWSSTQAIDVEFPDDPYWTDEDFAYIVGLDYAFTDWYFQGGPVRKVINNLIKIRAVRSF